MAGGKTLLWLPLVIGLATPVAVAAQTPASPGDVTFTKDIAPILQRSCQNCHRPDGVAPMSLITYEEVRPWARAIKQRTGIGPKAGVMPPWYIEKNIGIQHYKDDPSLSDDEIAKIAKWADSGAPRGNPADMPPPLDFDDGGAWRIGKPDLVVSTKEILVKGNAPDWWGEIESVPIRPHRRSLRLRGRDQGSQRRPEGRHRPRHRRRPLRLPSHDLEHARAQRSARGRPS